MIDYTLIFPRRYKYMKYQYNNPIFQNKTCDKELKTTSVLIETVG